LAVIILILLPIVKSVRINEVELNPAGTDSGNEWIELYSPVTVDLTGYLIHSSNGRNSTKKRYNVRGSKQFIRGRYKRSVQPNGIWCHTWRANPSKIRNSFNSPKQAMRNNRKYFNYSYRFNFLFLRPISGERQGQK